MEFPFLQDTRLDKPVFTVTKGHDKMALVDGACSAAIEKGDWVMKTAAGFDITDDAVKKVFPVFSGKEKPDAAVTGGITVIVGGGVICKTTKFAAGAYVPGQALTVKAGTKVVAAAAGTDYVCAHVWSYDAANGVLEYLVTNR